MMGGRQDDRRMVRRQEDSGTMGDNTPATLGAHWELVDMGERDNDVVG